MDFPLQHTLAHSVSCTGIALHTGAQVSMTLHPASENTGIRFVRSDLRDRPNEVQADFRHVTCTRLGTTLTNEANASVATTEHLMAALWGSNVDNAIIELSGPEVPIMDGSSEPFVFLIECAGLKEQRAPRRIIEILKTVEVTDGEKRASLTPASQFGLSVEINFNNKVIAHQAYNIDFGRASFKTELCRARTFGFEHEVAQLREMGLARGGSLENAIVVGEDKVLNEGGLRYQDEFVRHKALDCIGDIYLAGAHIRGHVHGVRTGHDLNHKLLTALFADRSAWRMVAPEIVTPELAALQATRHISAQSVLAA